MAEENNTTQQIEFPNPITVEFEEGKPIINGYDKNSFIVECSMRLYYAVNFENIKKPYSNIASDAIKKAEALAEELSSKRYLK